MSRHSRSGDASASGLPDEDSDVAPPEAPARPRSAGAAAAGLAGTTAAPRPPDAAPAAASAATPSMAAAATTQARAAAPAQARSIAQPASRATAQVAAAAAASPAPPAARLRTRAKAVAEADRVAAPAAAAPREADPPAVTPTRPYLRQRAGMVFGVHVGQIITWQVAVLAMLVALQQPPATLVAIGVGALLLLVLTMIPVHGRWLFQWLALWIRYVSRHRRRTVPDSAEGALDVLLRTVTRGGHVGSLDIDGSSAALIRHAGGLTVLLSVTALESGLIGEPAELIPPLSDLLPPAEEGEPVVSAQIVLHSTPAPSMSLDDSAVAISYRTLANGAVPSQRRCWVALQALRTTDDHRDDVLCAALTSGAHRLQRKLRKAGLRGRAVSEDEAAADMLALARLTPTAVRPRRGPTVVREDWRTWSAGSETQTTFRILDWPDLATPYTRNFLNWLAAVPTVTTTVAVAARRNGTELELEAAVRVTLPDQESLERATRQVQQVAERAGARMQRLDGEQVAGLAASLPLGGFLS